MILETNLPANFPPRFPFPFLGLDYLLVGLPSHKNKANPTISSFCCANFFKTLKTQHSAASLADENNRIYMIVCKLLCRRSSEERVEKTEGITKKEQVTTEAREVTIHLY